MVNAWVSVTGSDVRAARPLCEADERAAGLSRARSSRPIGAGFDFAAVRPARAGGDIAPAGLRFAFERCLRGFFTRVPRELPGFRISRKNEAAYQISSIMLLIIVYKDFFAALFRYVAGEPS